MTPPAPPRFSITNEALRSSAMRAVTSRATRSTVPPAGNGTITRIGRSGYSANALLGAAKNARAHRSRAPSEKRGFILALVSRPHRLAVIFLRVHRPEPCVISVGVILVGRRRIAVDQRAQIHRMRRAAHLVL